MNAHALTRRGSLVEVEFAQTKSDQHLDRAVLDYLLELAEVGAEMRCRLMKRDNHLVMQLDEPQLREPVP